MMGESKQCIMYINLTVNTFSQLKKKWRPEAAYRVSILADKPVKLSPVPRARVVGGRNQSP